jgi:hypothetical protein
MCGGMSMVTSLSTLLRIDDIESFDTILFTAPQATLACGVLGAIVLGERVAVSPYPRMVLGLVTGRAMMEGGLCDRVPSEHAILAAARALLAHPFTHNLDAGIVGGARPLLPRAWSPEQLARLGACMRALAPEFPRAVFHAAALAWIRESMDRHSKRAFRRRVRAARVRTLMARWQARTERVRAVATISRAFERRLYDPHHPIGIRRLMREWRRLQPEVHGDAEGDDDDGRSRRAEQRFPGQAGVTGIENDEGHGDQGGEDRVAAHDLAVRRRG